MSEVVEVVGAKLMVEEILVKEQKLADMRVRTIRRRIFNALPFYIVGEALDDEYVREHAVALMRVSVPEQAVPDVYILFDDGTRLRAGQERGLPEDVPLRWRWMLGLPPLLVV